ncbi:MAG TPA: SapC family protein [Telluria sp.]|nr:SapC family protein [Telluria sp.]
MPQFTAVTPEFFANKSWQQPSTYAFAAQANVLPVIAAELAKLVPRMPLGFVQTEAGFQLVAIASLQPDSNFFIAPDGRWLGDYVPAVLRSYPFRLVKLQDRDESILCFDESSGSALGAGIGEAFFDAAGTPGAMVNRMLDLVSQIERSRVATQAAVDALQAAGLIQPWPLNMQQGDQTIPVEGLYCIDEAALLAVQDDAFLTLRKAGALPLAYAQLLSMSQLDKLQQAFFEQSKLKTLARQASNHTTSLTDLGFKFSDGETLHFQ